MITSIRHCEGRRPEAIQNFVVEALDCRVAVLLAMTERCFNV